MMVPRHCNEHGLQRRLSNPLGADQYPELRGLEPAGAQTRLSGAQPR